MASTSLDLNFIGYLWEHVKQQFCKYDTSPKGSHDCGSDQLVSGMKFHWKYVKTS